MSFSRPLATVVQLSAREPSDALLVSRVRSGVSGAEEALYMRHVGPVLGLCQRLVGDRDEAEDVLQETFLQVFDELHTLRNPGELKRWIAGLVVARVEALFRQRRARRLVATRGRAVTDDSPSFLRAAQGQAADVQEQLARLNTQLARLRDRERACWLLFHVDGYSLAELAELTHRPLTIVRRRLHRAERALRLHDYAALTPPLLSLLDARRPERARELLRVFLARRELRASSHAPFARRLRVVVGVLLVLALMLLGVDKHARHEALPLTLRDQRNLPRAMLTNTRHHAFDLSDGSRLTLAPGARLDVLENSARELVLGQREGRVRFDLSASGKRDFRVEAGEAGTKRDLSVSTHGAKLIIERGRSISAGAPEGALGLSSIHVMVEQGDVVLRGALVPAGVQRLTAGQSFETTLSRE